MWKTRVRNAVAGAAVAALSASAFVIVGNGSTFASWTESASFESVEISSGNLHLRTIGPMVWSDASAPGPRIPIDLETFTTTPGDRIDGRQSIGVSLSGKNMEASFKVSIPTATGGLVADTHGVNVTYSVHNIENGVWRVVPGAYNIPAGQPSAGVVITPESDRVVEDISMSGAKFVVQIVATFDSSTSARTRVETAAAIANATVELTQVR